MRSRLREWWPELLAGAILAAAGSAGQKDDPLFAVFMAIVGAIFWAMGHRHRGLPLHRKVDRMTDTVGELVRDVRADREPRAERGRPQLRVVRRD